MVVTRRYECETAVQVSLFGVRDKLHHREDGYDNNDVVSRQASQDARWDRLGDYERRKL